MKLTVAGLPAEMLIAGMRLRVHHSFSAPSPLPEKSTLLRRTKDGDGRIASRYWQTSRRGRFRLDWMDTGTFDLDVRSAEVACFLVGGTSRGAVEEILRGPVCAFFLLERGFEPLHAGAVAFGEKCVAFAGNPGAGKSSLVAWMSRHGARLLCDDILPLRLRGRTVWGYPGLPQLCLDPPAARELGWKEPQGARREPREKSKFRVATLQGARRVERVYLLERRKMAGGVQVRQLAPRQAFRALLKCTRNDSLDTPQRLRRQMRLFARLARNVSVCRLRYSSGYAKLPAVLAGIRHDLHL